MDKSDIAKRLQPLAKKYSLDIFVIFGSFATNSYSRDSDVDLAFYAKDPLSLDQENALFDDCMTLLAFERIDLINLNTHYSVLLRHEIFSKGMCLFESSRGLFQDLAVKAWFEYVDFKDVYANNEQVLLSKVARL